LRDLHEARSRDSERIVLFVGDVRIVLPELVSGLGQVDGVRDDRPRARL